MASQEQPNVQVIPRDNAKILKLWKIAGILFVVTVIEFIFAFNMTRGVALYTIFILLTLLKAFYIIAEFMHLKHEVKSLIWSIVIPVVVFVLFVLWLVCPFFGGLWAGLWFSSMYH
jgi:cytochrome c oxidase subunit IV